MAAPRQLCADMARAHWKGTIMVPRTYPCAVVARPSGQSAIVARPSRQSAAVAPPKQSSANVAPLQWQHTIVVQSTCTCAAVAQSSGHGAVVAPPGQPYASVPPVQWQSVIVVRKRAPSWRDLQGRAPPRRCPDSPAPTWHQFSDMAPPWCTQRTCAVVAQPSGQSATVALPRWFSCASLAMVYPPGQYSRHHGRVCTWRSANLRDTPCKGDVSSAVLTASRAIGERRRLARAPSWCHFLGHVPSRCTYRRARRLGWAFAAGRRR